MTGPVMRHQPAPAIDLEQFREAVESLRLGATRAEHHEECDRLLALIDGQANQANMNEQFGISEGLPLAINRIAADSEDVRIARIIAEKIDEGRLDHPGFYKNDRLSEALRNILALIDGHGRCATCGTVIKSHPLTGTIFDCALKPTKGEGVAGG